MSKKKAALEIKPPKITFYGYYLFLVWVGMPILAVLSLMDGLFYLLFRYGFDSCYGLLCLL